MGGSLKGTDLWRDRYDQRLSISGDFGRPGIGHWQLRQRLGVVDLHAQMAALRDEGGIDRRDDAAVFDHGGVRRPLRSRQRAIVWLALGDAVDLRSSAAREANFRMYLYRRSRGAIACQ